MPALILREALNKRRRLAPFAIQSLRWILDGKHPNTGRNSHGNLDHVNPARAAGVNFELLKKHIPGEKATTALGLSNLLAWMLSGQGFSTQSFLKTISFFFNSAEDCIACFTEARSSNEAIVAKYRADHPNAQMSTMKSLQGYVVLDDPNVWGQAANDLCITPTIRFTNGLRVSVANKLGPYFSGLIRAGWITWLGGLYGQDPDKYTGLRHSWSDTINMIRSLNIPGIKGLGLTTLQLANNLALLNICTPPDAAEMGTWIGENPKLGAYKGLVLLGFKLRASDPLATRAAFQVFYDHCERNLTQADKELLGFGAIFVEHLLCKVQRWQDRYNTAMSTKFARLRDAQSSSSPWIPGNNQTDAMGFPFPLGVDGNRIGQIIKDIIVSLDLRAQDASDMTHRTTRIK
ncbi:hypothetical protein C8F04DRAFT_947539 [Mycena alexandri]|uniref:Uncharacterized protein n=1 Tax=Mycena alexandri TaxID=1745969 RepID=A0AAD6T9A8_9AGAR|nr:hypothetical protein C8F04DRAFT_947539 [Mycena alexandri]